ncbi:hypothetical protein GCM10010836_11520 [Aminobacter aminovorans]
MSEVSEERTTAAPSKAAYSIDEFCETFGVGRTLAYDEVAAGRLLTRKAGRRTLIRAVDAQAWLDALPSGRNAA